MYLYSYLIHILWPPFYSSLFGILNILTHITIKLLLIPFSLLGPYPTPLRPLSLHEPCFFLPKKQQLYKHCLYQCCSMCPIGHIKHRDKSEPEGHGMLSCPSPLRSPPVRVSLGESLRDWSLITGRGGPQNGKIAGQKAFAPPPPQDRVKLSASPLLKSGNFSRPPYNMAKT